jgi:hypothetical protein
VLDNARYPKSSSASPIASTHHVIAFEPVAASCGFVDAVFDSSATPPVGGGLTNVVAAGEIEGDAGTRG